MGPLPFGGGNHKYGIRGVEHFASLQWGHRLSVVETQPGPPGGVALMPTSMGPPPFGGGNSTRTARGSCSDAHFNGATAFRWWKLRLTRWPGPICTDFNGATAFRWWKRNRQDRGRASRLPSMGPPPFGGGNLAYGTDIDAALPPLQWGHRLSVVETALSPKPRQDI